MKTIWITFADDGLITSAVTNEEYSAGMMPIEVDDSFELESVSDYRFVDGELTYTGEATAAREEAEEQVRAEEEALRQRRMAVSMILSAVAESMDNDELASVALALPKWEPGVKRKKGAACRHEGVAYRVVANVSKNNDAKPGTPEGADFYAPVNVGPSGVQA